MKIKVKAPFMYNGKMLQAGDEEEMNEDKAVRHMRAGDLEKDQKAIEKYKNKMIAKHEAQIKDLNNF